VGGNKLKIFSSTWVVGVVLILIFSLNPAMAREFGSKVAAGDNDIGVFLEDFNPSSSWPVITWWDCGTTPGMFDPGDVLYLDTEPLGVVSTNDVRLTPYDKYAVGTKVTAGDNDMGKVLFAASCPIVYANMFGSPGYDFADPVYIKTQPPQNPPGSLTTNDVRLTSLKGMKAGSIVEDSDPDFGKQTTALYIGPYSSPATGPVATIRFYNANGNLGANNFYSLYDEPDPVYVDISNVPDEAYISAGWNGPNNVRLSL
jgi:hypothetical protein